MPKDNLCLALNSKAAVIVPNHFAGYLDGYQCPRCEHIFSSTGITITSVNGCQFDPEHNEEV